MIHRNGYEDIRPGSKVFAVLVKAFDWDLSGRPRDLGWSPLIREGMEKEWFIPLQKKIPPVMTMDLAALSAPDSLLVKAREVAAATNALGVKYWACSSIEVTLYTSLEGSGMRRWDRLRLPFDRRLPQLIQKWGVSRDPELREMAAQSAGEALSRDNAFSPLVTSTFSSVQHQELMALLQQLSRDPYNRAMGDGLAAVRYFPVRRRVIDVTRNSSPDLSPLRETVDRLPVHWPFQKAWLVFTAMSICGGALAADACLYRRRRKHFRGWCSSRTAFLSVLLMFLICFGWWDSYRRGAELACRTRGIEWQISSWRGKTRLLLLSPPFANTAVGWMLEKPGNGYEKRWEMPSLLDHAPKGFASVNWASGTIPTGLYPSGSARFTIWSIPHWMVLALASLPVVPFARRLMQRRSWRKRGRCIRCGYDLRATQDRCPECGEAANWGGTAGAVAAAVCPSAAGGSS